MTATNATVQLSSFVSCEIVRAYRPRPSAIRYGAVFALTHGDHLDMLTQPGRMNAHGATGRQPVGSFCWLIGPYDHRDTAKGTRWSEKGAGHDATKMLR